MISGLAPAQDRFLQNIAGIWRNFMNKLFVLILIFFLMFMAFPGQDSKPQAMLSPIVEAKANPTPIVVQVAYEGQTGDPVINEISRVFSKEGTKVIAKMISCAYGESKMNPKAYNFNKNGTGDYNIFQINSIHVAQYGDKFMHDWKENIRVAYEIYKKRGFKAWYHPNCR
jgi:hypothetical protein